MSQTEWTPTIWYCHGCGWTDDHEPENVEWVDELPKCPECGDDATSL